jgi:Mg/Co/Ni transporter MgtE
MNDSDKKKLQNLLKQRQWAPALEQLRALGAREAADFLMTLAFEEQRVLFQQMPVEFAASLIVHLPYYPRVRHAALAAAARNARNRERDGDW